MATSSKDSQWWTIYPQPLDRFWWSLVLFLRFSRSWFQWNTFINIICKYHGDIKIMKHLFSLISENLHENDKKMINWNSPVWLVRFFQKSKMASEMATNSMDSPKSIFCKPLADFGHVWVIWYVFLLLDSIENIRNLCHGSISITYYFRLPFRWRFWWKSSFWNLFTDVR